MRFASEKPLNDSDSEESESEESMTELSLNAHHTNKTASSKKFKTILKGEKVLKCTIQGNTYPSYTESTWYGDSGASCHITNDDNQYDDVEKINELIGGIGPDDVVATKKGKKKCMIKQAECEKLKRIIYPCKYCKDASDNLYSITSKQSKGAKLSSDKKNNILLCYPNGITVSFDR